MVNCGSSPLKYSRIDVEQQTAVDSGIVERIGKSGSVRDHREALDSVLASIDTADITAVAHRVVCARGS